MAVGRTPSPNEVAAVKGKAGRLSAAPAGGVYVRDPAAARAHALQERAQAYQDAGEEVPEELAAALAEVQISDDDEDINLYDKVTGELLAEAETEPEPEAPAEPAVAAEVETPPPPPVPEMASEPEPEPEVEQIDVDSLTVAELKEELDARGVDYTSEDRKADLQQKLSAALGE